MGKGRNWMHNLADKISEGIVFTALTVAAVKNYEGVTNTVNNLLSSRTIEQARLASEWYSYYATQEGLTETAVIGGIGALVGVGFSQFKKLF